MKEHEALIRLQALVIARQRLEATLGVAYRDRIQFDEEISTLRARLSIKVLRLYDELALKYANPVEPVTFGACPACGCEVPSKTAVAKAESDGVLKCVRCGRLLVP